MGQPWTESNLVRSHCPLDSQDLLQDHHVKKSQVSSLAIQLSDIMIERKGHCGQSILSKVNAYLIKVAGSTCINIPLFSKADRRLL